jgi:8-oxo-dGTP diphosphatase
MTHWRDRFTVVPAVYIVLRKEGKILVLKRANTGYRDGSYSLPGGHIDGHESATQAAIREAEEEIGVSIDEKDLHLVYTQHCVGEGDYHERINLFFSADKWDGSPVNAEPNKSSEIRWSSLDDMPEEMVPELGDFIKSLKTGEPFGYYGF